MRTSTSSVTFERPFILNRDVGELPAGTYEIEIDEEEIRGADRTGYCRTAVFLYVQAAGSTRTVAATPKELDSALERDKQAQGSA